MTGLPFADRREAGEALAAEVRKLDLHDPVVLALPRGGVPVGYEVARAIAAPLDILLVRKIGAPGHEEFGIGAMVDGASPQLVLDESAASSVGATREYIAQQVALQLKEIERRRTAYRTGPPIKLDGRTVVLVDDGIATGGECPSRVAGPGEGPVSPHRSCRSFGAGRRAAIAEKALRPGRLPLFARPVLRRGRALPRLYPDRRRRGRPAAGGSSRCQCRQLEANRPCESVLLATRETMVATQPDIEPDRITPQAPPETPPGSPPDENPFTEPPGFEPPMPGENDPYPGIPETPPPLD